MTSPDTRVPQAWLERAAEIPAEDLGPGWDGRAREIQDGDL